MRSYGCTGKFPFKPDGGYGYWLFSELAIAKLNVGTLIRIETSATDIEQE
jgi:hypothetical protein